MQMGGAVFAVVAAFTDFLPVVIYNILYERAVHSPDPFLVDVKP